MSPTINVYLTTEEFVTLANLAIGQKVKATLLVRRAVQNYLRDQKQKET